MQVAGRVRRRRASPNRARGCENVRILHVRERVDRRGVDDPRAVERAAVQVHLREAREVVRRAEQSGVRRDAAERERVLVVHLAANDAAAPAGRTRSARCAARSDGRGGTCVSFMPSGTKTCRRGTRRAARRSPAPRSRPSMYAPMSLYTIPRRVACRAASRRTARAPLSGDVRHSSYALNAGSPDVCVSRCRTVTCSLFGPSTPAGSAVPARRGRRCPARQLHDRGGRPTTFVSDARSHSVFSSGAARVPSRGGPRRRRQRSLRALPTTAYGSGERAVRTARSSKRAHR